MNKTLNFLTDAKRWTTRLAKKPNAKHWLVPIDPSLWKDLIQGIQSPATQEWLENQKGIIKVPPALFPEILYPLWLEGEDGAADVEGLMIFRQDTDAKPSTGGLLPPCKLWSPLAKETSTHVYQVKLQGNVETALTSYLLSSYAFNKYQTTTEETNTQQPPLSLYFEESKQRQDTLALVEALYWTQDLISTPANHLTPGTLQDAASEWAATQESVCMKSIVGDDLLNYNGCLETNHGCGMIHAVGRGAAKDADRAPRLLRLYYEPPNAKIGEQHICLLGKGVTFDTGGLNLKPGASMINMRKDMGGAAVALGLFRALVEGGFPKPVQCWIPSAENSVDGSSYRPGDILTCVNGVTTFIGNTDAEGRLILADALALASAEKPDMMMDFATLTGAQRVAMGLDVPSVLSNQHDLIPKINEAAVIERDPVWPLPLWEGYRNRLKHKIADLQNVPDSGLGGCITAALYLSEFVGEEIPWVHVDFNGLDIGSGLGQAQSLRTMYRFLRNHYG